MLQSVELKQIAVTPIGEVPLPIQKSTETIKGLFSDTTTSNEDKYLAIGELVARIRCYVGRWKEAEKLFRSEVILAIQGNPALLDGKVTEKTVEAFYRSQQSFVEINATVNRLEYNARVGQLHLDMVAARMRLNAPVEEVTSDD